MVLSYTYSTIFEDEEGGGEARGPSDGSKVEDYSISEICETFTIVQNEDNSLMIASRLDEEDTDVEEDDDFDEYSEVTFEQPKALAQPLVAAVRARKNTVFGAAPSLGGHSQHGAGGTLGGGLCHCAETYRNARDKRRRAVSTVVNMHQVENCNV